eukprot:scaffold17028_cov159-Isochrysis_galbana.AAC.2
MAEGRPDRTGAAPEDVTLDFAMSCARASSAMAAVACGSPVTDPLGGSAGASGSGSAGDSERGCRASVSWACS